MKEKSFLFILSLIAFVFVFSLSGYKYYQKNSLEKEFSRLQIEQEMLLTSLDQSDYKETLSLFSAKKILDEIDKKSMKWSSVIKEINATIPKDANGNLRLDVVSYSGSGQNTLSLNVSTIPGANNPYYDVADFIKAFDSSIKFSENFVPSISSGINTEGREILSFSFSTIFSNISPLITR